RTPNPTQEYNPLHPDFCYPFLSPKKMGRRSKKNKRPLMLQHAADRNNAAND
ncbi:unnamed protein product, partial [Amoebophrya sp. A25]